MRLETFIEPIAILSGIASRYPSHKILRNPYRKLQRVIDLDGTQNVNDLLPQRASDVFFTAIAIDYMHLLERATSLINGM